MLKENVLIFANTDTESVSTHRVSEKIIVHVTAQNSIDTIDKLNSKTIKKIKQQYGDMQFAMTSNTAYTISHEFTKY